MVAENYIPRHLISGDKTIKQDEALNGAECLVILAEPGAGKTELLESYAQTLGVTRRRASVFRHKRSVEQTDVIILDGLDEVAKVDASSIDGIFASIAEMGPQQVILASRSSEWDEERNSGLIHEFTGLKPVTLRLEPFSLEEQKSFFEKYKPGESFDDFFIQSEEFELDRLLGNPQFLQIFADAYISNNRKFESKLQIFSDAVLGMAEERNKEIPKQGRPANAKIQSFANDIFAKLLLSGSTGVTTIENTQTLSFPYLYGLSDFNVAELKYLLDSRYFKPGETASLHEPMHRIVAEYCAANHIADRIRDTQDPLSLRRCLSLIAPNGVVRKELRGLLGWLAALSPEETQIECIGLDPYAVLANGDPSQLELNAKRELIEKLSDLAQSDPYFRRSDAWRKFSARGLFSAEMVPFIKEVLLQADQDNHLPQLILELLYKSSVISDLQDVLEVIAADKNKARSLRTSASDLLISLPEFNPEDLFAALVQEASNRSLDIASSIVQERGVQQLGREKVLELLYGIADLYPKRLESKRVSGSRYFILVLVRSFSLTDIEWFLDQLTKDLKCICGKEDKYDCYCRNGTSKLVVRLLDHYFDLKTDQYEPKQIWGWLKNLHFHNNGTPKDNRSVAILHENEPLRRAIHILAFEGKTDPDILWKIRLRFNGNSCHSGLYFMGAEQNFFLQYAFEQNRPELWKVFCPSMNANDKGPVELRTLAREHANAKPEFMKVWALINISEREFRKKHSRLMNNGRRKNWEKKREKQLNKEIELFNSQKEIISEGKHWGWIQALGQNYLQHPEENLKWAPDNEFVENALENAIPFVSKDLLSLEKIAKTENSTYYQVIILHACCLTVYRKYGGLETVDRDILRVVKTDTHVSYRSGEREEKDAFEAEINKQIFQNSYDTEKFVQDYIEPQLSENKERYTNVEWLRYKPEFEALRDRLPLEWLTKYSDMPTSALSTLFDLAVQYGDREELVHLIENRCNEIFENWPKSSPSEKQNIQRGFWFLRSFVFCEKVECFIWNDLRYYPDTVLTFESLYSDLGHPGHSRKGYPPFSAEKIFMILDAFVEVWPKVHLPNSWGTGSPSSETAYRYLSSLIWQVEHDTPEKAMKVLNKILSSKRFSNFHNNALHLKSEMMRKLALRDFTAPKPSEITAFFERSRISSVEDLRAYLVER